MLIDMLEHHKVRYGVLLREERLKRHFTQKEVIQKLPILSLRSYIQLENRKPLVESETYDMLCSYFDIQYNYEMNIDSLLQQHLEPIMQAYTHYDNEQLYSTCQKLIHELTPYQKYAYENKIMHAINIFNCMIIEQRILTNQEYNELYTYYSIYPELLQSLLASCIYYYQYQFPHVPAQLHTLFYEIKYLHAPDHIRNVITYCLHSINIEQNYIDAYMCLLPYEHQFMLQQENWTGLFDVYHWMCNICVRTNMSAFEKYHKKAISMLEEHEIEQQRESTFYGNLSGNYHTLKQYQKASYYMELYLSKVQKHRLPAAIWYIHNERLLAHPYPSIINEHYAVHDCSRQLQILWLYYIKRVQEDERAAEQYLMKNCLPVLCTMAVEFHIVFLHELKELVKVTRNYKHLYTYIEQLHI